MQPNTHRLPLTRMYNARLFLRPRWTASSTTPTLSLRLRVLGANALNPRCTRSLATETTSKPPSSNSNSSASSPISPEAPPVPFYTGPLSGTFHRLKLFSLSSLGLATAVSPLMLVIDSPMPTSARIILACTAITTSGLSTALVGWCGSPYVSAMWKIPDAKHEGAVEMATRTVFLREMRTRVLYPTFLKSTSRPFAKWELAKEVVDVEAVDAEAKVGTEEVVAETRDKKGNLKGRWIVKWRKADEWSKGLVGDCRAEGKVVRYVLLPIVLHSRRLMHSVSFTSHFNVHEEILENTPAVP